MTELEFLRQLYRECVKQRDSRKGQDHPLREWMRMSEGVRLCMTSLEALYMANEGEPAAVVPAVKHEDCTCAECRDASPPARITIALDAAPAVITSSIRTVFEMHGIQVVKPALRFAVQFDDEAQERLFAELGRNVAQGLCSLDETTESPALPAPAPVRRRGGRR